MASEHDGNDCLEVSFARIHTAATDSPSMRKSRGAEARSDSMSPQGLKHRISILEKVVHGHVCIRLLYRISISDVGRGVNESQNRI